MAATGYAIGTAEDIAVKQWSSALQGDVIMGNGLIKSALDDGILIENDQLSKGPGDKITEVFGARLTGAGILGDGAIRASAVAAQYSPDATYLDKLAKAVTSRTKGSMAQQRVGFDLEEDTFEQVSDWYKQRLIASFFKQLGGELATTITYDGTAYSGDGRREVTGIGQLPTAPTTYRKKFATGSADETVQAATTAKLTLSAIHSLYSEALLQRPGVNNFPALTGRTLGGLGYMYVFYVSVTGMNQLIEDATANQVTFGSIILAQINGGKTDTAASLGRSFVHRFVKVVEVPDHYIPNGVHSSTGATQANVKRALFCGRKAASLIYGKGYESLDKDVTRGFTLKSDPDTIDNYVITKAEGVLSIKKHVVSTYDYGVITYSHYVA